MRPGLTILAGTAVLVCHFAYAADYPARPVRWVVGFPAGGANDIVVRLIAPRLGDRLGQSVIVDNRPGAHGNLAAEFVARSSADGHTLLLGTNGILSINPTLYRKLAFDPVVDFAPVGQLVSLPIVIVVHPSIPVRTLGDLIALAKSQPAHITYATSGNGGTGHLAAELLKSMTGIDITHVPYKGGAPAIVDLLGGHVNTAFAAMPTIASHVKDGKLKALAVTTLRRSAALPDVPTVAEAVKLPDYEANSWYGVVVPAKTRGEIIARLHKEILSVLKLREVQDKLVAQGLEPAPSSPDAFGAYIRAEILRWSKIIPATGLRID